MRPMTRQSGSASYLYAVTRPFDPQLVIGIRGVTDRPVRQVPLSGLAAVVSTVDLAEFGEAALRRNLEQLPWLEAVARAHHTVVNALAAGGSVVPFRLATVYLDDSRMRSELNCRREDLGACLDRLDGRTEWSVKVLWQRPSDENRSQESPDDRPGTAFLRRRTAAMAGLEQAQRAVRDQVELLHAALVEASVESRRYPPQPPQLTGETREMLLNGAYLVDGSDAAALSAAVAAHSDPTLHCAVTGPWATYSFAGLEGDS